VNGSGWSWNLREDSELMQLENWKLAVVSAPYSIVKEHTALLLCNVPINMLARYVADLRDTKKMTGTSFGSKEVQECREG
jgi:hypothetical protein